MKHLIAFNKDFPKYRVERQVKDAINKHILINNITVKNLGEKDRRGNVISDPEFIVDYDWDGILYDDLEYNRQVLKAAGKRGIKQLIDKVLYKDSFILEDLFRKLHPGQALYRNEDYDFEELD